VTRRLFLVRHGETAGQSSIRYHGKNDVPLSELGRQQIRGLLPLFAGAAPVAVLHSPLSRARESAAILAKGLGLPAEVLAVDDRLAEISFGDCEGMTAAEIAAAFPEFWAAHQAGATDGFPGGEKRSDFSARVAASFADLLASPWRGDVLVVAHRGTVSVGLRTLLASPGRGDRYAVELGSLTELRHAGGWQLERLGVRGVDRDAGKH
jgi:broad specificity phosphatase PhoE